MKALDAQTADFTVQWKEYIGYLRERAELDPRETLSNLIFHHRWRVTRWTLDIADYCMENMMARGKNTQTKAKENGNAYNTRFLDIPLGKHTQSEIVSQFGGSDILADTVQSMCEDGYRIGLSYNAANDAIIASITCRNEASVNAGCTFTAFAGDWVTALQVLCYKHIVIAEGNWVNAGKAKENGGIG